jgi:hypothetical protein
MKALQLNSLTENCKARCKDVTLAISRVYLASITVARQYTINSKKKVPEMLALPCSSLAQRRKKTVLTSTE